MPRRSRQETTDDFDSPWLLIHIEIQGDYELEFPQRMFLYNVRAFQLYNRPVASLAVLTDDQPQWRPDRFEYGDWGCSVGIRLPLVKLIDWAAATAFNNWLSGEYELVREVHQGSNIDEECAPCPRCRGGLADG